MIESLVFILLVILEGVYSHKKILVMRVTKWLCALFSWGGVGKPVNHRRYIRRVKTEL